MAALEAETVRAGVERDAVGERVAELVANAGEVTEVPGGDGRGRLDLQAGHAPVVGLEDEVDLGAVPVAEVVPADGGVGPRQLLGDLVDDEGLQQGPAGR